jgi:hypothetical protein
MSRDGEKVINSFYVSNEKVISKRCIAKDPQSDAWLRTQANHALVFVTLSV